MSMTPYEERRREEMRQESQKLFAALPKNEQDEINAIMAELSPLIRQQVIDPHAGMEAAHEQTLQVLNLEAAARYELAAAQNQLRNAITPVERKVMEMYPAVDITGKYCVLDVRAAEQEARIDAALQNCNPGVATYVESLRANPAAKAFKDGLAGEAKKHRLLTYAAESYEKYNRGMEELKAVSSLMRLEARQLESSRAVMDHTIFMEGLEYAVGLNKSSFLSKDVANLFKNQLKAPLDKDMLDQAKHPNNPQKFTVVFENLENIMNQYQRSDPANWDKFLVEDAPQAEDAPLAGDVPLQKETVEKIVASYARGTTDRLLDALFPTTEKSGLDKASDRGSLIIIDGKTVRERIYENYMSKNRDPAQFDAYYQTNYQRLTNECVAAGLMADKRVEVFVPDKNGKIPAVPAQITRSGYEPSPLKPIAMNAWHRFWSQYGFYKKRVAQAEEYQRMEAARNRVTVKYYTEQLEQLDGTQTYIENQFTSKIESEHGGLWTRKYLVDLSGTKLTSLAACRMLADGYSVQDIFDPEKLQDEKALAGEELVYSVRHADAWELGAQIAEGQFRLMQYFDEAAKTVDFTDHAQLCDAENKTLFLAAITARDIIAESSNVLGYDDCVPELFSREGLTGDSLQLKNRLRGVSAYLENVRKAALNSAHMVNGMDANAKLEDLLEPILASQIQRDRIQKAPQGQPLSQTLQKQGSIYGRKDELKADVEQVMNSQGGKILQDLLQGHPEAQKSFGRDMLAGRLQERMQFDLGDRKTPFKLNLSAKDLEKHWGLQPPAPQAKQAEPQKAKGMGGMTRC